MKWFIALFSSLSVCAGTSFNLVPNDAYGYFQNIGIPEAKKIRMAEDKFLLSSRIVGGDPVTTQKYPWQAGLIIDVEGLIEQGVCGGSLISNTRVVTAAHCWFDGQHQARQVTVVLGTVLLFYGGTRLVSNEVVTHHAWMPILIRNDIAVVLLQESVTTSVYIAPIALPNEEELKNDFAGLEAVASGFGKTSEDAVIIQNQSLSHVTLLVIPNRACFWTFPLYVHDTTLCTSGHGEVGPCGGDSGGPLVVFSNGRPVLIGVISFGATGCQSGLPTAYSRVTSYIDFIKSLL